MTTENIYPILENCSPEIGELIIATRQLIAEVYPDVVEVPWVKQKTIGYGIGEKKMSEHFSWIGIYTKHIVLGFSYGTQLNDPEQILEGTGKLYRHYKVRQVSDLENPSLKALLHTALRDIQERNSKPVTN